MRILLLVCIAVLGRCDDDITTTSTTAAPSPVSEEPADAAPEAIMVVEDAAEDADEDSDSAKSKRTVDGNLGYGFGNDVYRMSYSQGDQRAFYPSMQHQQYYSKQQERYYPRFSAQAASAPTSYSQPTTSADAAAADLLLAKQLQASPAPVFQQSHPLLLQQQAISPLAGLFQSPLAGLGGQHMIPILILRVNDANPHAQPTFTTAFLQMQPVTPSLNLQALMLQYLQQQQGPAVHGFVHSSATGQGGTQSYVQAAAAQVPTQSYVDASKLVYVQPSVATSAQKYYSTYSVKKAAQDALKSVKSNDQAQPLEQAYSQYKYTSAKA